ncbi:MAG: hypothetical protein JW828_03920 [Sedimentisphaerales bacterium]|nr:hypothetical protein [Sedimentisphaerales bacterium]
MTGTSRQRLQTTLAHQPMDGVCVDFGATHVTGINVSVVAGLRRALLGEKEFLVKVSEPYQMLGEIDDTLADALGIDVMPVMGRKTMFGFENKDWKPFTLFDGTEVLVPEEFNLTDDGAGGYYIYPEGDTSVPPSGHMPKDGYYFDAMKRQEPIFEDKLDPADNLEEFGPLTQQDVAHYIRQAEAAAARGKGAILSAPGTAFGDIALVPACWRKHVKGIRDVEEWYISTALRRDYVYKVFEGQCQIALANLETLARALGDKVQAVFLTGTDFGTQRGLFISPAAYRDLYKPFHKTLNDFVHANTHWKTFIHSCGSVIDLIPDFIEAGFDILNPVQCSATGMDAEKLKCEFGDHVTFWGGGVDTQQILPFGTPEQVYDQTRRRIEVFNKKGGFVFNTIHNIQAKTPVKNVLAMLDALRDARKG